jgi:hypothetical protein
MKLIKEAKQLIGETHVLTKTELRNLRRVKTTMKEADMILSRNIPLLKAMQVPESYSGSIGCPHCHRESWKFLCYDCWWNVAPFNEKPSGEFFCCGAPFGGIRYCSVAGVVNYGSGHESVHPNRQPNSPNLETCRFLQGHLEWALDMLQKTPRKQQ